MKAKRNLFVSLITLMLLLCCSMLFVACDDEDGTTGSNPTYTVAFKVDSRNYDVVLVEDGKTVTLPTAPEKDGYTFDGWYADEACLQGYTASAASQSIDVYAKFTANVYTITYEADGGANPNTASTFTVEDKVTLADAQKSGFTFDGWYLNGERVSSIPKGTTGNVTLTAKYIAVDPDTHRIAFLVGGKNYDVQLVKDGNLAVLPTTPETAGYTFGGWFTDENCTQAFDETSAVTVDTKVYAKMTANTYTLTYNANGGMHTNTTTTFTVEDRVNLQGATKSGYAFEGWYLGEDRVSFIPKGTAENVTLTAKFIKNGYVITYEALYGADNRNPIAYSIESEDIILKEAYLSGYEFTGWYDNEDYDGEPITVIPKGSVGDVTLYAKFELIVCNVTFNGVDGVDNEWNEIDPTYSARKNFYLSDVSKEGYTFDGWYDKYDMKVEYLPFGDNYYDVTLTAKWTPIVYRMDYKNLNGADNSQNPVTFTFEGGEIEIANLADTLDCEFKGWSFMNGTPQKDYVFGASAAFDVTLVAVWETKLAYRGLKYYTSTDGKNIIITGVTDTGITEITVPDETYLILEGAFKDCTALKSINIPFVGLQKNDTQNAKLSDLFGGTVPSSLKNVTIRGGGTIPKESFKNCTSITTLTLTGDVQTIEESAFYGCTSLDLLYMQDSKITTIGKTAFSGCKRLVLVKLPTTLTEIGLYAFSGSDIIEVYNPSALDLQSANYWEYGYITDDTKYIYNSLDAKGKLYFDEKGNLFFDSDEGLRLTRYRSDELAYTIPDNVKIIDDYVFQGRSDMQSVTWSDSIKSIGESAFEGCGGITSLNVTTEGLTIGEAAFYECPSITEFTVLADNVTIGEVAFRKCPNLVSVSLTGKGLEIKYDAFYECSSLENVQIAVENSKFGSSVFSKTALKSVAIYGDGVQLSNTFAYSTIQEVDFNANNITATGYLFRGAQSLKTVTVNGNNVQFIGNWNFDDCSNLTEVRINGSVTAIGDNCFRDCTSLESITLKGELTSFGKDVFKGCTSLKRVVLNPELETIGEGAFKDCSALSQVKFNSSLKSIGNDAFNGCTALTTLSFNDNLESIGDNAFNGCIELTTIEFPDSLTSIGSGAFAGCKYLHETSELKDGIAIDSDAFANCKFFEWIVPVNADNIDNNAFRNCQGGKNNASVYYMGTRAQLDALGKNFGVFGGVYAYSESAPDFINGSYTGDHWHYNKWGEPEPWNYDVVTLSVSTDSGVKNMENTCGNLMDGNKSNVYAAAHTFGTVEIIITPSTPVSINQFILTIGRGADKPGRIPKQFTVAGTNADTGAWEEIFSTTDAGFSQENYASKTFTISDENATKRLKEFKFSFKANGSRTDGEEALTLEWSEIELMLQPVDWTKSEGYDFRYRAIDGDNEYINTTDGDTSNHWVVNNGDTSVIIEAKEKFVLTTFNLWSRRYGNVVDYDYTALAIKKVIVYGSNDDYYQGNIGWHEIYRLDNGSDIINSHVGGKSSFLITNNTTAYKYYKFTLVNGNDLVISSLTEIELLPTTLVSSVVVGSAGNEANENYDKLADGNAATKWCLNFDQTDGAYVIYEASSAGMLCGYTFTTANDNSTAIGRNPKSWTIYGSNSADCLNDDYTGWSQICTVSDDTTMQDINYTSYSFTVESDSAYRYFKIVFTENGGNDMLQLSEIALDLKL